jgi:tetratricopeptide (TPR) repeat protein
MDSNVRIERVCGGAIHLQNHPDTKGNFYFQMNNGNEVDTDAATSSNSVSGAGVPDHRTMTSISGTSPDQMGCEIRAAYPGYRSDVYTLRMRLAGEEVNVGTLILHRLGGITGTTMSITTALAPKRAQKDYERGMELVSKGKFLDAERSLQEAATLYPNYALAWFAIGQLQQRDGKLTDAKRSYQTAVRADTRYVSPYVALAQMAGQQKNWDEVLGYTKQTLSLNSVEFPSAYWYDAVANFQLSKWDDAQRSLTELLKLDSTHRFPDAEGLMGRILLEKGDLSGAADHMRIYLQLNPHASDAAAVQRALDKLTLNSNVPGSPTVPQTAVPQE